MGFGTSKFGQLGFLWVKLQALVDELRSRKPGRGDESARTIRAERRREVSNELDAYFVRLVTIAFLVAVLFSSPRVTVNAVPQTFNAERALLEDANRERVAQGLAPLRWNANLAAAAHAHALLMAQRNTLSHQFSGEAPLQDRVRAGSGVGSQSDALCSAGFFAGGRRSESERARASGRVSSGYAWIAGDKSRK